MCIIVFGVLRMMFFLVAARRAGNAVVQLWKIVNCLSTCVLTWGINCKGKGHYMVSRVWNHPVLCWLR